MKELLIPKVLLVVLLTMLVGRLNAVESKSSPDSKEPEAINTVPGNWGFTDSDARLAKEIQQSLPGRVFDFHAHIYRVNDERESSQLCFGRSQRRISRGVEEAYRTPGRRRAASWRTVHAQCFASM